MKEENWEKREEQTRNKHFEKWKEYALKLRSNSLATVQKFVPHVIM